MSASDIQPPVSFVRTLQIIVAALAAGCVFFLAMVLVLANGLGLKTLDSLLITYVALAFAGLMICARAIVPTIFVAQARRKILKGTWAMLPGKQSATSQDATAPDQRTTRLVQVFFARTIIATAILEGPAFLLLVAYMLERSPLSLSLAVVLILALAAHFPTCAGVADWIENQTRLLVEERPF